ncbi:MAG: ATP-dependent helicase [Anaerolineae bacterium]
MQQRESVVQGLNEQQRQAVTCPLGPTLVLAGPGSGKTRVLTSRIAYMVEECNVPPYAILAVTFTNKASREMRTRLERRLGSLADDVTMGTFHSVCVRILRREADTFGLGRNFVIYDQDDQVALMKAVLKRLNADDKKYRPAAVLGAISRAKSDMHTAATYSPPTYWHEMVARAFEIYEAALRENNALDFDDLLLKTVEGLQEHPEVLQKYRNRYRHVLVDEFQDTNTPQYELIRLLAAPEGSVFVVGDEDQSIYGWRGADYRNIERFRRTFPTHKEYLLERNYRSTQNILDAAKAVIARNVNRVFKDLSAEHGEGEALRVVEAYAPDEEAAFVVGEIERLVATREYRLSDIAIMYRMNAQSRALEEAFIRQGVPYRLVGGTRFYQRREIKEVLSYLRLVATTDDWVSFERVINVPPRGIGEASLSSFRELGVRLGTGPFDTLHYLQDHRDDAAKLPKRALNSLLGFYETWQSVLSLADESTVAEVIDSISALFGYGQYLASAGPEGQERLENVQELRSVASEHFGEPGRESLSHFLDEVALVADVDELETPSEAVVLMTLHTAKGLEFPVVFMVGMQEGVLPHSRSLESPDELEEERRLCYVGITRAMKQLYLTYAMSGGPYGRDERNMPSRFLRDLPPELVQRGAQRRERESRRERMGIAVPERPAPIKVEAKPVQQFQIGDTVAHATFGEGTVVEWKPARNDAEVTVMFKGVGKKRLLASLAGLQKA